MAKPHSKARNFFMVYISSIKFIANYIVYALHLFIIVMYTYWPFISLLLSVTLQSATTINPKANIRQSISAQNLCNQRVRFDT